MLLCADVHHCTAVVDFGGAGGGGGGGKGVHPSFDHEGVQK